MEGHHNLKFVRNSKQSAFNKFTDVSISKNNMNYTKKIFFSK